MREDVNINIASAIRNKTTIEEIFILQCFEHNMKMYLEQYVNIIGKFSEGTFKKLMDGGYLQSSSLNIELGKLTFDKLKLTEKYYKDFYNKSPLNYDLMFDELKEVYPKRVKGRALHTNLSACKKKYKEIVDSEETHKLVLECLKMYIADLTKNGKIEFIQMMPTWLNQHNYTAYVDDVKAGTEITKDKVNYEGI